VLVKALGLSPHRVQVSAQFVACTSSYTHESSFTLGCYTEYARGTVNFGKFYHSVSLVVRWGQTPMVKGILGFKLKPLQSETVQQNLCTKC